MGNSWNGLPPQRQVFEAIDTRAGEAMMPDDAGHPGAMCRLPSAGPGHPWPVHCRCPALCTSPEPEAMPPRVEANTARVEDRPPEKRNTQCRQGFRPARTRASISDGDARKRANAAWASAGLAYKKSPTGFHSAPACGMSSSPRPRSITLRPRVMKRNLPRTSTL